jgi:hypothetical protein
MDTPPTTPKGVAAYLYSVAQSCRGLGFAPIVSELLDVMVRAARRLDPHVRVRASMTKYVPFEIGSVEVDRSRALDAIVERYGVTMAQVDSLLAELTGLETGGVRVLPAWLEGAAPFVEADN